MNATGQIEDCSSKRNYPADEMYHNFLASTKLSPPTEGTPGRTQKQQAAIPTTTQCTPLAVLMTSFYPLNLHPITCPATHENSVT